MPLMCWVCSECFAYINSLILTTTKWSPLLWQKLAGCSQIQFLLPGYTARLHFPASFVIRLGTCASFWPMKHVQKWYITLPDLVFEISYIIRQGFSLWMLDISISESPRRKQWANTTTWEKTKLPIEILFFIAISINYPSWRTNAILAILFPRITKD